MYLPQPLPDETLHSWFSRVYIASGVTRRRLCHLLFGKDKVKLHPFLPAYLPCFAKALGQPEQVLVVNHTLYPLFEYYAQGDVASAILSAMNGTDGGIVINKARIPHSKVRSNAYLFYCPKCAKADIAQWGVSYWHCTHHIPGVSTCSVHNALLHRLTMEHTSPLCIPAVNATLSDCSTKAEIRLAKFSSAVLAAVRDPSYNIAMYWPAVYQSQLGEMGMMTHNGRVRNAMLIAYLTSYWCDLGGFNDEFVKDQMNFGYIGKLLHDKQFFTTHPIRHLLLGAAIFESATDMVMPKIKVSAQPTKVESPNVDAMTNLYLNSGKSINEVAQLVKRSCCFVRRVKFQNDAQYRRQFYAGDKIYRQIWIKALLGDTTAAIASVLYVTVGKVEQVISRSPCMAKWRKHLRRVRMVIKYRLQVQDFLRQYHNVKRQRVRDLLPAACGYLYLYDKYWLETTLPKPLQPAIRKSSLGCDNEPV
jgi:hypothetical protein